MTGRQGDGATGRGEEADRASLTPSPRRPVPPSFPVWVERGLVWSLALLALAAPHTIAGAQGAWALALLLWVARVLVRGPRKVLRRTPLDYWLLGFICLTFLSSFFSYEPLVSLAKHKAVSLFTIVYLAAENLPSRRAVRALALLLVASCALGTLYTFSTYAAGRGVRLDALAPDSPLPAIGLRAGDTVLEVNGRRLRDPEALARALDASAPEAAAQPTARLLVYHLEAYPLLDYRRVSLLEGGGGAARLGIAEWSRGRDERATGLYGHYTTYAEVLQLVASVALGMLVAHGRRRSLAGALLAAALALMTGALVLTVTRASWLGLVVSALVVALSGAGRRAVLIAAGVALPLALVALVVLQQKRQVGFIDPAEGSTAWRLVVWREGLERLTSEPRHLVVGVGMDSLKSRWREWGMFEGGRLPWGHLHSTPLQIAFERGVPALLVWLGLLAAYARMLWRLARRRDGLDWTERGLCLGALGGAAGFFTSGLVHYNLGDSEVVMVFYLVMGLALALERLTRAPAESVDSGGRLD